MRKLFVCALALGGIAASAQAADLGLDSMKDPLPDTITYKGVTVYGAIDIGYAYQTHGAPLSGSLGTGLQYNMFGAFSNNRSISTIAPNGLTQSFIGFKVEEPIGMGWTVLARGETGFEPTSGELADGCASLARNNGVSPFHQTSVGDSSRCGQAFNGELYAGVSNATYGTLKVGRQNSLDLDLLAAYDPMALSYAFSLLGYSGGAGGGIGATEDARWDNSIKYIYQYGPVHASFMYAQGGEDTGLHTSGISGGAGGTWKGFSVDFLYTKENGAVAVAAPFAALPIPGGFPVDKSLNATISDNSAWTVGAKYTFDLAGWNGFGYGLGGLKDEAGTAKFTVFGGYQHEDFTNPTDPVFAGSTTVGGYILAATTNNAFTTDRIRQTYWAGGKYDLGPWSFTGAYYGIDQNSYVKANISCAAAAPAAARGSGLNPTPSQCAGRMDMGAFLVDYAFNKHFDVYAGVNYSTISGGLASGFIQDNSTLFMTGMRLKF